MLFKALALAITATAAGAQVNSVNLSHYQLSGRFPLPATEAAEASAVTYNWDTGTLFVLGDEGDALVEVSRTGALLNSMTLTGFDDTEGLTYLGCGQFAIAEERDQDVYRTGFTAGGSVARSTLPTASLGPTVGNVGIEGISDDPVTGRFVAVKEKTPQQVLDAAIDFVAGTAVVGDLFTPTLGVLDLSDVQVLSVIPSLSGRRDAENLLIYSQESALLMEVTRSGDILSQFDSSSLASDAEGVTIDSDGVIYIVGESPELFVLSPIPTPASAILLAGALFGSALRRRR